MQKAREAQLHRSAVNIFSPVLDLLWVHEESFRIAFPGISESSCRSLADRSPFLFHLFVTGHVEEIARARFAFFSRGGERNYKVAVGKTKTYHGRKKCKYDRNV